MFEGNTRSPVIDAPSPQTPPSESVVIGSDARQHFEQMVHELMRADLAEGRSFHDRILSAGVSVRANLLEKWEGVAESYHLTFNPPTATLCILEGKDAGRMETIGLRQFLELALDSIPTDASTTKTIAN
jgi:hypothetical protein